MRERISRIVLGGAIAMVATSAVAQAPARPSPAPPAPAIAPLSPSQQTAVLLGRWETCIDLAAQFMAYSALGQRKSTANVVRKCSGFEAQLRPVLEQSLSEMMYGSSEQQVADQANVAVESLRRHIQARAAAAVRGRRDR